MTELQKPSSAHVKKEGSGNVLLGEVVYSASAPLCNKTTAGNPANGDLTENLER